MQIHVIAVLGRIDFLKGWPGLAWAGLGPGGPWKLEVKIHIIAVLFEINFQRAGLAWSGLAWDAPNGALGASRER